MGILVLCERQETASKTTKSEDGKMHKTPIYRDFVFNPTSNRNKEKCLRILFCPAKYFYIFKKLKRTEREYNKNSLW